jgi:V8-like Glu-specific endopeptidase
VYVIGHPSGRELSYSIQDNSLLNHRDELGVIHYRSPTEPGSSGSPLFSVGWDLLGLHHSGNPTRGLNHALANDEAREGIWIRAVIKEVAKSLKSRPRRATKKARKSSRKRGKIRG